jgi:hypothetical protein
MDHFAGLDVSVKETSVCILDDAGKRVQNPNYQRLSLNRPIALRALLNRVTGREPINLPS